MPIGLIHPELDGQQTHFFEWREAGVYTVNQGRGTMFQGTRIIKNVYFGFDHQNFYLRVDSQNSWKISKPVELIIRLVGTEEKKLHVRFPFGGNHAEAYWKNGKEPSTDSRFDKVALQKVLEIALPLADLGWKPKDKVRFSVEVVEEATRTERHPDAGFIELEVPDSSYESSTWKV